MATLPPPPFASASAPTATTTVFDTSFATLFHIVPVSAICPFLHIADVLCLSSVDLSTRQLVLSSPTVWRTKVFKSFPLLTSSASPTTSSFSPASSFPSSSRLPSWCAVVQLVKADLAEGQQNSVLNEPPLTIASLLHYPNLRRVEAGRGVLTDYHGRKHSHSATITPAPFLSSMRHLTRLSLHLGGQLTMDDMRLLATLPVLASFVPSFIHFESGNEETLRQWQALTGNKQQLRSGKRKAEQLGEEEIEDGNELEVREEERDEKKEDEEQKDDELIGPEFDNDGIDEDPNDPRVQQQYSAVMLFLHQLAAKPSLVHLDFSGCDITPFILDHMPVWPHLLSLDVTSNESLNDYTFQKAATCFPSLTSLSTNNCSDAAIAHLVRLPALEELRFPEYQTTDDGDGVLTSTRGFRLFGKAAELRSVQYWPPEGGDAEFPSVVALTSLFTLANLTRLTINAFWPVDGLFVHHFQHLRCLELIQQYGCGCYFCPQTDELLMPLVKPLDVVEAGREQRQAARAVKRGDASDADEVDDDREETAQADVDIAAGNAANFPSLECLDLPYDYYNHGDATGEMSAWMMRQLRRSYEYEVAAEWEAEQTTLGVAELLKTIMA